MRGAALHRREGVLRGTFKRLTGQGVHHVQIEIVDQSQRRFDCFQSLPAIVNTAERLEPFIVKALNANGKTIDAICHVTGKSCSFVCSRVGLQSNFSILGKQKSLAQTCHQGFKPLHRHQTRRSASEKDT